MCVVHFGIMRLVVCFISRIPVNLSSCGGRRGGSFERLVLFKLFKKSIFCVYPYLFRADVEMNENSIAFLPLFIFYSDILQFFGIYCEI